MNAAPSTQYDLQNGLLPDIRAQHNQVHPVAVMQKDLVQRQEVAKLQSYQANFGFHVPFKMMHERQILSESRRLPGERSSLLGLEVHMNNLESLQMEDYMNTDVPMSRDVQPHTVFLKQ